MQGAFLKERAVLLFRRRCELRWGHNGISAHWYTKGDSYPVTLLGMYWGKSMIPPRQVVNRNR